MSVKVMTKVFDRYPNGGGEMLLALALADHAHDDGTHIWPKVEDMAEKTRQSVRAVQYQLRHMEKAGWLILTNSGNGGRNQHREYRISPDWLNGAEIAGLKKGAEIAPLEKGATDDGKGANGDSKGCNYVHPHITAINHKQPSLERATRLPQDWKLPKTWGEFALAEQPTWIDDHVRREADKFRDYWVAKAGKDATKRDWFATWRNWVRNAGALKTGGGHGAWWISDAAKLAKANEVGVGPARRGESDADWEARIREAIDNGGKPPVRAPSAAAPIIRESIEQIDRDNSGSVLKDAALAQLKALTRAKGPK
jgi:hypothetical protein